MKHNEVCERILKWRGALLGAVIVTLLLANLSFGQGIKNGPLKMLMTPLATRARSQAPLPVTITLKSTDLELIRGELMIRIQISDRQTHLLRIPDLALTNGETRFRIMIPEVRVDQLDLAVRARAEFTTGSRVYDLGEHDIVIPVESRRNSTIINVQSKDRIVLRSQLELLDSLALHRFSPENQNAQRVNLVTNPSSVSPDDLPTSSIALLGVDLVLIHQDNLADLRVQHLAAVVEWVRAGGSVCVVPPHRGLEERHIQFLNALAAASHDRPAYGLDVDRKLQVFDDSPNGVRLARPGLGRAVIVEDPDQFEPWEDSRSWIPVVCFLWKMRLDQTSQILRSTTDTDVGVWVRRKIPVGGFDDGYVPLDSDAPLRELTFEMRPPRAKSVPYLAFLVILLTFLLLAAPGDYFLLGWLKMRRYTWWFLPICSLGFTWLTASIAERSLGTTDFNAAYDVVDIGEQGDVVRATRFEMVLVASPQVREIPLSQTIYVDLTRANQEIDSHLAEELRQQGAFSEAAQAINQRTNEIPVLTGRPPFEYVVQQNLRKWAPVVSRQTALGGGRGANAIPWRELAEVDLLSVDGALNALKKIREREPSARVMMLTQGEFEKQRFGLDSSVILRNFIRAITIAEGSEYFSVLSQVGPTGHSNQEDLKIHDPSDPDDLVLIVVVPRGADKTIYRCRLRRQR